MKETNISSNEKFHPNNAGDCFNKVDKKKPSLHLNGKYFKMKRNVNILKPRLAI